MSRAGALGRVSVWLGALGAAALLCVAYHDAALHSTSRHYLLFWLGMALFLVPAALRLLGRDASRGERLGVLLLLGLVTYLPKYLRNPHGPLFHDELAHWTQTQDVVAAHALYVPNNLISILPHYPGLHVVTAALEEWAGVSTFQAGLVLLIAMHLTALFMVHWAVERLTGSTRAAGIAALLYALNPSYLYFDTEYAYESLGVAVFLAIVACAVSGVRARGRSIGWWATAAVLGAGCIVTHHLSTAIAAIALVAIGVGVLWSPPVPAARRRGWYAIGLAGGMALGLGAWIAAVAPDTVHYIGQYITGGLSEVTHLFGNKQGSRSLFSKSTLPFYERAAAFAAPPIVFGAAVLGLRRLWRNRPVPGVVAGLTAFGLLYFPSLAFILSQSGTEGARRSWAFTYLGLTALIAPAIAAVVRADRATRLGRLAIPSAIVAAVLVVLVGNVAAGQDETYRFPGPYVYGSDTRSQTAEERAVAAWTLRDLGPHQPIVADRYVGLMLASYGRQRNALPSKGFPVWQLTLNPFPSDFLINELRYSHFRLLFVDDRMARMVTRVGAYYARGEPQAGTRVTPPPAAWIEKYEHLPWTPKVFQTDSIAAYRFDFPMIDRYGPRRSFP